METIICDISAFQYWRIPPVVRLLTEAPPDDPLLLNLVDGEELERLRAGSAGLPLARACWASGARWRAAGPASHEIRRVAGRLAAGLDGPIDVLVTRRTQSRRATLVRPRVWASGVPESELRRVDDAVRVVSPAFSLLQLAARTNLTRTVLLASELCGTFAVFVTPDCVREVLQGLVERRRLPRIDGWSPCLDENGLITDLWSRRPLASPEELLSLAEHAEARNGRARLAEAARLVTPGAASPFEVRTGVLLGFPRSRGGEGHTGFSHNRRVALTPEARRLAGRASCYCDLYWDEGVDVECQSALAHGSAAGYLSDSDRTTALGLMGIAVVPVTYPQITTEARLHALSKAVARQRGMEWRPPTDHQRALAARLRAEVLADWGALPFV